MEDRKGQLDRLAASLRCLVSLLEERNDSTWIRGLREFQEKADSLQRCGFSQVDLSELSAAVMSVYGGMGSFNDYIPQSNGRIAPWADEFDRLRTELYERALALRVVDSSYSRPFA